MTAEREKGPHIVESIPICFQFRSSNISEELEQIRIITNDTISIRTTSDYVILRYLYNPIENVEILLRNGDSLFIDKASFSLPKFSVQNNPDALFAVNYDVMKRQRYGTIYGYTAENLKQIPSILFIKSIREKFDYKEAQEQVLLKLQHDNLDEIKWLDSLYRVKLLDSVEYHFYKSRNHYQRLYMELEQKTKDELRSILATYSASTYIKDFYLFYRNYFHSVVQKYYYDKTIQLSNGTDYDFKDAFLHIEQDTLLSGRLRDEHLYYCFRKIDELHSVTDGKKYYDKVLMALTDTAVISSLHKNYDEIYSGEIAFSDDLALRDAAGNETTLQAVISANVGKVIYVDFWASWCAPCMASMPASTNLRHEYKSKDVVFVYLAFNDKEEAWKNAISKANLSGTPNCYLVTNPKTSRMVEALKLKSIPRYLFYDKTGRLVNENAPRPESEEIRPLLNKYL